MSNIDRLRIVTVKPNGQAEQIGIKEGDILDSYNGNVIENNDMLAKNVSLPNTTDITITIYRNNEYISFSAKPGPLGISATVVEIDLEDRKIKHIITTTSHEMYGYNIINYLGIVTSEATERISIVGEIDISLKIFGGNIGESKGRLGSMSNSCLIDLKKKAYDKGANAVIGVNFNTAQLSTQSNMAIIMLSYGTAVLVEPVIAKCI